MCEFLNAISCCSVFWTFLRFRHRLFELLLRVQSSSRRLQFPQFRVKHSRVHRVAGIWLPEGVTRSIALSASMNDKRNSVFCSPIMRLQSQSRSWRMNERISLRRQQAQPYKFFFDTRTHLSLFTRCFIAVSGVASFVPAPPRQKCQGVSSK